MARLSTKWKRESQENKYDEDKINNENLPKEINIGLQGRILKVKEKYLWWSSHSCY